MECWKGQWTGMEDQLEGGRKGGGGGGGLEWNGRTEVLNNGMEWTNGMDQNTGLIAQWIHRTMCVRRTIPAPAACRVSDSLVGFPLW